MVGTGTERRYRVRDSIPNLVQIPFFRIGRAGGRFSDADKLDNSSRGCLRLDSNQRGGVSIAHDLDAENTFYYRLHSHRNVSTDGPRIPNDTQ